MRTLLGDTRYAVRGLAAAPGFAAVVVIALTLGIGANTAVFTVVNTVLLGEVHGPEADRVVRVYTSGSSGSPYGTSSYPDFVDFRHGVSGMLDIGFAEAETLDGGLAYGELAGDRRAVIAHPFAISLATCTTSHTRSSPWVGVW